MGVVGLTQPLSTSLALSLSGALNILLQQEWWGFDPNTEIVSIDNSWYVPEKVGTSFRTPQPTHCLLGDGTAEFFIESTDISTISYSYITPSMVRKGDLLLYFETDPFGDGKDGYRFTLPSESIFYILIKDSEGIYCATYRCDEFTGDICIQSYSPEYVVLRDSEGDVILDSEDEVIMVRKDPEYLNFMN